jgi:acetoin utilization deacetylase AcuC-like enzyme
VEYEDQPFSTYEVPARADAILSALKAASLGLVVEPRDFGIDPILAAHDPGYVAFLRGVYAENASYRGRAAPVFTETFATRLTGPRPQSFLALKGYYAFGFGSPILEGTWEAAYWAAQCALTAADLVRAGSERAAYALCRPPGHHAASDLYGGYCYFNNAAIAARLLRSDGDKVAVLDVDYHHGNGTQAIFYSDPGVLCVSLHADTTEEYPFYWGARDERGEGPGLGGNSNWPLPQGTCDAAYLETLEQALAEITHFSPRWLVVSAGFDTVENDPEGGFRMTRAGLAAIGRRIAALDLPSVIVQEGGYLLERLGHDAVAFLDAFAP